MCVCVCVCVCENDVIKYKWYKVKVSFHKNNLSACSKTSKTHDTHSLSHLLLLTRYSSLSLDRREENKQVQRLRLPMIKAILLTESFAVDVTEHETFRLQI